MCDDQACKHLSTLTIGDDIDRNERSLVELAKWVRVYPALWRHAHSVGLLQHGHPPFARFVQVQQPVAKKPKKQGGL